VEVVADAGPVREIVREQAPRTAGLFHVQQRIDHFPQGQGRGTARPGIRRKQRLEQPPLSIRQVRWVAPAERSGSHDRLGRALSVHLPTTPASWGSFSVYSF